MFDLVTDCWGISCEIILKWMPLGLTDDESTFVQVMAWCREVTSHYLSQCWPRSVSPYGVTRPQWVQWLIAWWHQTIDYLNQCWLRINQTFCSAHINALYQILIISNTKWSAHLNAYEMLLISIIKNHYNNWNCEKTRKKLKTIQKKHQTNLTMTENISNYFTS